MPELRRYEPEDETSWTRCRTLAFLQTAYFDDVLRAKPVYEGDSRELVAVDDGEVVGLIDLTFDDSSATIETIAVHPDRQQTGIATALLTEVLAGLPTTIITIDAWTRDDASANRWYQRHQFVESYRYLHVYANELDIADAGVTAGHGLRPVAAFFHAESAEEVAMRERFHRVHVCRQYVLRRAPAPTGPR